MVDGQKWIAEINERNLKKAQRTWFLFRFTKASCRWEERKSCKKSLINTCCDGSLKI